MRHLSEEELLLYAEGELEERLLCQHVADCVDCKARLVDVQESYVQAADLVRAQILVAKPVDAPLGQLRARLELEAELLQTHLSTEDLLLSVECDRVDSVQAHIEACTFCQDRRADLHVKLAEIECELHQRLAYEMPAERRAAALATLRERLAREVEIQTAETIGSWDWVPRVRVPAMSQFVPHAVAATAIVAAWIGWSVGQAPTPPVPAAEPLVVTTDSSSAGQNVQQASAVTETVPVAEPVQVASTDTDLPPTAPERFEWTLPLDGRAGPPTPTLVSYTDPPAVALTDRHATAPWMQHLLPALSELQAPSPAPLRASTSDSATSNPAVDTQAAIEGAWMLARADLWKEPLTVNGSTERLRFSGVVSGERERSAIQRKLGKVAGGWPLEFALDVAERDSTPQSASTMAVEGRDRPIGGPMRTALVRHYEDAARRSLVATDSATVEGEVDRYVSDLFRHETELLAHVHALNALLSLPGIDSAEVSPALQRTVQFHTQGILNHGSRISDRLEEALPSRFWNYDGDRLHRSHEERMSEMASGLLDDALALDRSLVAMFFGTDQSVDARAVNASSASMLRRIRERSRRIRGEVK